MTHGTVGGIVVSLMETEGDDLERIDPLALLQDLLERVRETTTPGPEHDVIENELAHVLAKEDEHGRG